jgi:hypothetical protein
MFLALLTVDQVEAIHGIFLDSSILPGERKGECTGVSCQCWHKSAQVAQHAAPPHPKPPQTYDPTDCATVA